ncbi:hypothetical protein HNY73_007654 [Argiope bruennichi]|uniref:Uncharacterized protein n=1 Tax=Argiope bruennichi TaxID=94029 RepID=A0A8T0FH71_ARGBR|nr:hypothetical protein HNY73_007654 [Argiope bruennichi]
MFFSCLEVRRYPGIGVVDDRGCEFVTSNVPQFLHFGKTAFTFLTVGRLYPLVAASLRKIVMDRMPKPGVSFSEALTTNIIPSAQTSQQNSQTNATAIGTPLMNITQTANNDMVTIKRSDWLALLEIKKAFEKASSSAPTCQTISNQPVRQIDQRPSTSTSVGNNDPQNTAIAPPETTSLNMEITSLQIASIPKTSSFSEKDSTVKSRVKNARDSRKHEKDSDLAPKLKEKHSAKHFSQIPGLVLYRFLRTEDIKLLELGEIAAPLQRA